VRGGVRVDAHEELRRRDVVIDEHATRGETRELVEDFMAHREVQDERVVRADLAEQLAVRVRLIGQT